MVKSIAASEFQELCYEYYTCFVFATEGMKTFAKGFPGPTAEFPDRKLFIGHSHPDEGKTQSVISVQKAHAASVEDGAFSDIIAKALLIRLYAEWDEKARVQIAHEFGVKAQNVKADLMGDLRRVRHWIVHGKSIVEPDAKKILVLPWAVAEGGSLIVTRAMMRQFMDCVNSMNIQIEQAGG